jgi:hypothetical protein
LRTGISRTKEAGEPMLSRGLAAGALALLVATMSCVAGQGDDESTDEAPAEVPLDLTIDRIEVAHGQLRLSATMGEGSADVSLLVGDACGSTEVGRGMATRSTFVWALAEDELAMAIKCDLVVQARVVTENGVIVKSLSLAVLPEVVSSAADEGLSLQATTTSENGVALPFGSGSHAVSQLDFARAVIMQRPLVVEGASFDTSVAVGGIGLEVERGVGTPGPPESDPEACDLAAPDLEPAHPEPSGPVGANEPD